MTDFLLLTIESEYAALSKSLRGIIPLLDLFNELYEVISFKELRPKIYYTKLKGNKGFIHLFKSPKMIPSTKHIALV